MRWMKSFLKKYSVEKANLYDWPFNFLRLLYKESFIGQVMVYYYIRRLRENINVKSDDI